MIYHLLIIKHFVKVKMNIIHQISWVNSLNNGFITIDTKSSYRQVELDSPSRI